MNEPVRIEGGHTCHSATLAVRRRLFVGLGDLPTCRPLVVICGSLTRAKEAIWDAVITECHSQLRRGVDVVVDDTNLKTASVRKLAEIGWHCAADVQVVDFTVPVEVCVERDAARPHPVGEKVIRDMARRYLSKGWPGVPERPETPKGMPYVPDPTLPKAIIVDVDGTVALHVTRDPYDTSRYHEDAPNVAVIAAVRAMHDAGHQVVFCSGRHDDFREVTEEWLRVNVGVGEAPLFMRPGPGRDDVVKLALFDEHIRDHWNVVAVFDDRRRVYDMWRALGLTVFAVAEGNF